MRTKLRYGDAFTLTCGASGLYGTEQVYRMNSLYDPDLTSTGHQPYGFDTLATIYTNYKVHGFRAKLVFTDPSADGIYCAAQFQPQIGTTVTGYTTDVIAERPGTWVGYLNNTGSQRVILDQYFPIWQLMGLTPSQFENQLAEYAAGVTANPTVTPYLRFAIAAADFSSTPTCRVQVILEFDCEFYQRKSLAQS
jgi:hypothetical protein